MTRHCPTSHQSVILMAHTAFNHPEAWAIPTVDNPHTHYHHVPPLTVPGIVQEIILEARLVKKSPETPEFKKKTEFINGLGSHVLDMRKHIQLEDSQFCQLVNQSSTQEIQFNEFSPGTIIVFRYVPTKTPQPGPHIIMLILSLFPSEYHWFQKPTQL